MVKKTAKKTSGSMAKPKPKPKKPITKEKPKVTASFDQKNLVYDVIKGESGRKNALGVLNKKVLDRFEMDDLFLE